MYIGGTDERAMHHLVSEILDNAMDEAVAGYASRIEIHLGTGNRVRIRDNGRGIPVDNHPKFPGKSALEVIFTTLHSGGKFSGKVYNTSGGLHGVGSSVVNALSTELNVEVFKGKEHYQQIYSRGKPTTKLKKLGATKEQGTQVTFVPDVEIFGSGAEFSPMICYKLARSKAYLYRGVEIAWSCDEEVLKKHPGVPSEEVIKFMAQSNSRMAKAAANSPSPGRKRRKKASSPPTATPSRRRKAAPMCRVCARPSPKASKAMRIW